MSLLSRLYTFASLAGLPIYGDNIDDELNQLVNLLAGISADRRVYIVYSNSSQPPLKLNQTGAGDLFKAQASGVDVLTISNGGVIVSTVSTGTAPITCASTTKVTNLNADMVNGIQGSALVRNDQASQALLGNLRIKKASTGTYDIQIEVDADTLTFYRYDSSDNTRTAIFSISSLNAATRVLALASNFRMQVGYQPTDDNDVVRKIDLVSRQTVLAIPGHIVTPGTTARCCFFNAPAECIITEIKYGYYTGTPSSDLTLTFAGQNFTLATAAIAENVYTAVLTPVTMTKNQTKVVSSGSSGGHTNVFCQLVGYYTGN